MFRIQFPVPSFLGTLLCPLSPRGEGREVTMVTMAVSPPPLPPHIPLFQVGFLKILHKYEITFLLPRLGKDICPLPVPSPNLRVISVTSLPEGHSVRCEYTAHKEGVLKEELLLAGHGPGHIKVTVQARVMGKRLWGGVVLGSLPVPSPPLAAIFPRCPSSGVASSSDLSPAWGLRRAVGKGGREGVGVTPMSPGTPLSLGPSL
uniref:Adipose-secreted signaling protein n=1 Tax=Ficedula albicollis TaxID=59894 RepID=A0A803WC81_FICAL